MFLQSQGRQKLFPCERITPRISTISKEQKPACYSALDGCQRLKKRRNKVVSRLDTGIHGKVCSPSVHSLRMVPRAVEVGGIVALCRRGGLNSQPVRENVTYVTSRSLPPPVEYLRIIQYVCSMCWERSNYTYIYRRMPMT